MTLLIGGTTNVMRFGRIDLAKTNYTIDLEVQLLNSTHIDEILRVYKEYCFYKNFHSVIPMVPDRFFIPNTEIFGYYDDRKLIAWSMYRIWDRENIVADHHAWDYSKPNLRIGLRSLQTECAVYKNKGYKFMYFESFEPYIEKLQGFEILGKLNV